MINIYIYFLNTFMNRNPIGNAFHLRVWWFIFALKFRIIQCTYTTSKKHTRDRDPAVVRLYHILFNVNKLKEHCNIILKNFIFNVNNWYFYKKNKILNIYTTLHEDDIQSIESICILFKYLYIMYLIGMF